MQAVYKELSADHKRLASEIARLPLASVGSDPEQEVEAALKVLERLCDVGTADQDDMARVAEVFQLLDVKLYLTFRKIEKGRRVQNVPAGGVMTIGSIAPPITLYHGPTDRPTIRRMLAAGESVSPILGKCSQGTLEAGVEVRGSGNAKHETSRCT